MVLDEGWKSLVCEAMQLLCVLLRRGSIWINDCTKLTSISLRREILPGLVLPSERTMMKYVLCEMMKPSLGRELIVYGMCGYDLL